MQSDVKTRENCENTENGEKSEGKMASKQWLLRIERQNESSNTSSSV